jgi:hypothetical protein
LNKGYILIIFNYVLVFGLLSFSILYSIFEEENKENFNISSDEARFYVEKFLNEKFNTSDFQLYSIHAIDDNENGLSEYWDIEYLINLRDGNETISYKFYIFFDKKIMDLIFDHNYVEKFYNDSNGTLVQLRKLYDSPYMKQNISYRDSTEIVPKLVDHFYKNYRQVLPENISLDAVFYVNNYWRVNYVFKNITGDYIFSYHLYYHLDSNEIEVEFQYVNDEGRRVYTDPNEYPPGDLIEY